MQEVLGTELEIGQEYYLEGQEKVPHNNIEGVWQTRNKYSAIYLKSLFPRNYGLFRVTNIYLQRNDSTLIVGGIHHATFTYGTPPENIWENFRTRFYRKTDTLKNQEKRDNLQKKEALAATYEGNYWNKENPGWRYHWYKDNEKRWKHDWYYNEKPRWTYNEGLGIDQYYGNDGQSQFARPPGAKPDGPSYLGGRRKRTLRRASKSKKRRSAARSKKRHARANKRKKTRRTKR